MYDFALTPVTYITIILGFKLSKCGFVVRKSKTFFMELNNRILEYSGYFGQ